MGIKIENYTPTNRGCVIGEVDVVVEEWGLKISRIQECRKNGRSWFNWPAFRRDGEEKFSPYVCFEKKETAERFFSKLREQLDLYEQFPQSKEWV